MLKTRTGARIKHWEGVWTCGAWSVSGLVMDENRPGRARQMRRMVAKARRRERRGYVPPAVKRARAVSAARAEVRLNGKVIGYTGFAKVELARVHGVREWPKDDEPETEFERASVDVARDDVARGDVMSLDDARVYVSTTTIPASALQTDMVIIIEGES